MEQWIILKGTVAHIRCKMTYTGQDHQTSRAQEMPAVFVDAVLKYLVYVHQEKLQKGKLQKGTPTLEDPRLMEHDGMMAKSSTQTQ